MGERQGRQGSAGRRTDPGASFPEVKARVRVQPEAEEQVRAIETWWRANRPHALDLFTEELAAAFRLLSAAPAVGRRYEARSIPGLRRLMLPGTRYHVY